MNAQFSAGVDILCLRSDLPELFRPDLQISDSSLPPSLGMASGRASSGDSSQRPGDRSDCRPSFSCRSSRGRERTLRPGERGESNGSETFRLASRSNPPNLPIQDSESWVVPSLVPLIYCEIEDYLIERVRTYSSVGEMKTKFVNMGSFRKWVGLLIHLFPATYGLTFGTNYGIQLAIRGYFIQPWTQGANHPHQKPKC